MKKVITYGSFDLFHEGHYKLLERAKALGDYLIVGVTTEHYDESRGKMNVVNSIMERIENVKKTGFADEIIIEDHVGQKIEDIIKYDIDIFTVGSDWTGAFDHFKEYCEVVYLERTKGISSSELRSNFNLLKLGIIGTGRIANRFIPEAKYVSGVNIESVYNPHIESARSFAEKNKLNSYFDDLESFLNNVDAVYIASPHETHYEYAKKALEHKKHVLCEKPMVLRGDEARELFKIAKENNCVLMEAIKTAYCPGFIQLINTIKSGVIGEVKDVEAAFTKLENPKNRELTDTEYGGCFTELASYTLLPIIKILGMDYKEIRFESFKNDKNIDIYTKAYIKYDDAISTSKTGLGVKSEGELIISGTKGYCVVEAPWWKTKSFELRFENVDAYDRTYCKFFGYGLRYELSDFVAAINGYGKKMFRLTKEESIAIAEIMERFLEERK
ncbi:MAG: glycerol-3-phosphate cytidylyltransferase [Ruminococcaceae bacterium]|nr:glycerol-3-phosphate cytidylyltransferase [Oscillospiraceae bacterium]